MGDKPRTGDELRLRAIPPIYCQMVCQLWRELTKEEEEERRRKQKNGEENGGWVLYREKPSTRERGDPYTGMGGSVQGGRSICRK